MLISIASRQLAVLHRYFSATGQQFNNHSMYIWKLWERQIQLSQFILESNKYRVISTEW